MEGYDVLTFDGDKAGTIVGREGEYLVVEQGAIFKHHRLLPEIFATVDDAERVVRTTLSRELLDGAPELDGDGRRARRRPPLRPCGRRGRARDARLRRRRPRRPGLERRARRAAERARLRRRAPRPGPAAPGRRRGRRTTRRRSAWAARPRPARGSRRPRAPPRARRGTSSRRPRRAPPGPSDSRSRPRGPRGPRSVPASRLTQRSQRTPLTWIVSLRTAMNGMLATEGKLGGHGWEALVAGRARAGDTPPAARAGGSTSSQEP